ncbi:MAG: SDR family oxidoreductase [Candidatus Pacebacteria bacterium]|jgi:nucleoside-diphosphate-sugar epimerase|nr:SDR family oxidoreductase [Candidatus Paceibacterota bacterium]MBT3512268.1 SDR family oxidoreductase [Candidatus Paceibacterota bacterium]MBT4004782.1 SDR family oxidoreductase [Candidatus Paceibacterota bacterium]MBT4358708.1 SDR family oxidoreductase [Candidatus Paceibacterota bacterium]MBT4680989.1 SDR family oxidoreductase [Candidatus Paceibacterota bacterium]
MQKFFHNKIVLVTGAAGFVGSNLVDALLKTGADVIGVDNFITGRKTNLSHLLENEESAVDNFAFIETDAIQSPATYLDEEIKVDVIFHLASPASPPRYQKNPVETYLVNSLGTHHLLDYLKTSNPAARFVFASTSEVYGDPQVHPQTENYWGNVNPNGVRSCYDEGKRLGETICGVFNRDFGLDVRIARIFNTYGPRIDPADGRVIPNFIKQALSNEEMTVYGDGNQTRSYCFVDDLVTGLMKLASVDEAKGETINLGNADEYTINETAQLVKGLVSSKSEVVFKDLPGDDPTRRKPDISKAKRILDWKPKVSFKEGLKKTVVDFDI